ncbi:amidohydrolase [Methylobacterium terricola]|uniref:Amidohydrolase n=1 Tax=Methylobacterium terricola TaxID=2583531 RepID=A0A5C4LN13_9HYPH|nr:amidohydrolase family protein [Methylobacterium terricola]TNC14829.1 amidohydrolase [Methylobacterium terricola]
MKLIAVEEHLLTPEVREAWADPASVPDPACAFDVGEIGRRLEDLGEERLRLMDEAGVDVQVLSLTTPGLHTLAPDRAVDLARRVNDRIAEATGRHPGRFQGLAALPTPAPDAAPRELERAVRDLGLKGAMLCGRTRERNLDHPEFRPLLDCAAVLGVPLFIHPQVPQRAVCEALYTGISPQVDLALSAYGLGWHYEAGVQFVRLVAAGVFDRLPSLQVILGHWGEVVLFYLERLAALDRAAGLERRIAEVARNNLHVTASGMFSDAYLARCVEIVGPDRLLFSTDYPYQYRPGRDARGFLERGPLGEAERAMFAHGNWERLTKAS